VSDLTVGIVGTGGIYRLAHGPAWRQISRAKVLATCDIIEERAVQARREMGSQASFASIDKLLANDGIDLIDICTPPYTHPEIAIKALRAGKHVICEKPMALTSADAGQMIRTAKETKRYLHIGHTRRFDRRWVQVKEQIASGRIGDPVSIRWSERCWAGFPKDNWHWEPQNGGVLMDLGVHVADLFTWLVDARPTEVFAKALSVREEAREKGCFDFGLVQLGFQGGKQGLMELSWTHPKEYAPFYSSLEIVGTRGKLSISDRGAAPMIVLKKSIEVPRYSSLLSTFPESFVDELNHFIDCLTGKIPPRITLEDASRAVEVVNKAIESACSGQPQAVAGGTHA
jgi:UDP-N-acetylglucosamine 3-dehydrogenase